MSRPPLTLFAVARLLTRLWLVGSALLCAQLAHAHAIDEVHSNAILEFQGDNPQHFQLLVLLGKEHLTAYRQILEKMRQPPERDRVELYRTIRQAFTVDACEVRDLPTPATTTDDPRFTTRENGQWVGLVYAVDCAQPLQALTLRRVGYSASRTRTTLYLAVALGGTGVHTETLRALMPPSADAMTLPLDGQPAKTLGPPNAYRAPAKDSSPGLLPSETMNHAQLTQARAQPGWHAPPMSVLLAWAHEGALHLATGPDHLLFLLTLVVASPGLPALLAAVTAFSVGHLTSMTVALWQHWPAPGWVDVAIGGTIALAAWRARRRQARSAWSLALLTAGFGLIHGLGFGNGLQQLVAGTTQLAWPLLSFGLGLDLAQVAWVLLCTGVWTGLRRAFSQADAVQDRLHQRAAWTLVVAGLAFAVWATFGTVP